MPKNPKNRRKAPNALEPPIYVECPHIHFKGDTIDRGILSRSQHLNLLSTPKGYRWDIKKEDSQERDSEGDEQNAGARSAASFGKYGPRVICGRRIRRPEKAYIHNFLAEIWALLTPEMIDRLKEMLMTEFGMSPADAELFVNRQRERSIKQCSHKITAEDKSCKKCCKKYCKVTITKRRDSYKPQTDLSKRHIWVKQFSKMIATKFTDYVVMQMCSKRSKKAKLLAERILKNLCDVTGENCTMQDPKTKLQRLLVFIADRLAAYIASHLEALQAQVINESMSCTCCTCIDKEQGFKPPDTCEKSIQTYVYQPQKELKEYPLGKFKRKGSLTESYLEKLELEKSGLSISQLPQHRLSPPQLTTSAPQLTISPSPLAKLDHKTSALSITKEADILESDLKEEVIIKEKTELQAGKGEIEPHDEKVETELQAESEAKLQAGKGEIEPHDEKVETELQAGSVEAQLQAGKGEIEPHDEKVETELQAEKTETELQAGKGETEPHAEKVETELQAGSVEAKLQAEKGETELKVISAKIESSPLLEKLGISTQTDQNEDLKKLEKEGTGVVITEPNLIRRSDTSTQTLEGLEKDDKNIVLLGVDKPTGEIMTTNVETEISQYVFSSEKQEHVLSEQMEKEGIQATPGGDVQRISPSQTEMSSLSTQKEKEEEKTVEQTEKKDKLETISMKDEDKENRESSEIIHTKAELAVPSAEEVKAVHSVLSAVSSSQIVMKEIKFGPVVTPPTQTYLTERAEPSSHVILKTMTIGERTTSSLPMLPALAESLSKIVSHLEEQVVSEKSHRKSKSAEVASFKSDLFREEMNELDKEDRPDSGKKLSGSQEKSPPIGEIIMTEPIQTKPLQSIITKADESLTDKVQDKYENNFLIQEETVSHQMEPEPKPSGFGPVKDSDSRNKLIDVLETSTLQDGIPMPETQHVKAPLPLRFHVSTQTVTRKDRSKLEKEGTIILEFTSTNHFKMTVIQAKTVSPIQSQADIPSVELSQERSDKQTQTDGIEYDSQDEMEDDSQEPQPPDTQEYPPDSHDMPLEEQPETSRKKLQEPEEIQPQSGNIESNITESITVAEQKKALAKDKMDLAPLEHQAPKYVQPTYDQQQKGDIQQMEKQQLAPIMHGRRYSYAVQPKRISQYALTPPKVGRRSIADYGPQYPQPIYVQQQPKVDVKSSDSLRLEKQVHEAQQPGSALPAKRYSYVVAQPKIMSQHPQPPYIQQQPKIDGQLPPPSYAVQPQRISQYVPILPKDDQQEMAHKLSQYPQQPYVQAQAKPDRQPPAPPRIEVQAHGAQQPGSAIPTRRYSYAVQPRRISQYLPVLPKGSQQETTDIRSQYPQPPYVQQQPTAVVRQPEPARLEMEASGASLPSTAIPSKPDGYAVPQQRISQYAPSLSKGGKQEIPDIRSQYPQYPHVQPQPTAVVRQPEPARLEMEASGASLPSTATPSKPDGYAVPQQRISQYALSLPKGSKQEIPDIRSQYPQYPYVQPQPTAVVRQPEPARLVMEASGASLPSTATPSKPDGYAVPQQRISQYAPSLPKGSKQEIPDIRSQYPQYPYVQPQPTAVVRQPEPARLAMEASGASLPSTATPSKPDGYAVPQQRISQYAPSLPKGGKQELDQRLPFPQPSYAQQPTKADVEQPDSERFIGQTTAKLPGTESYAVQPKRISQYVPILPKEGKQEMPGSQYPQTTYVRQEPKADGQQIQPAKRYSYVAQPKRISLQPQPPYVQKEPTAGGQLLPPQPPRIEMLAPGVKPDSYPVQPQRISQYAPILTKEGKPPITESSQYLQQAKVEGQQSAHAKRFSSIVHTKRISQYAFVLPKESQQEMAIIHSQYPQPTHAQTQPKADDRQSEPARSEMQVSRVSLPSTAKPVQQQRISQYAPSLPKEGQQEIPDIRSQYSQPPYIMQQAKVEGQQISQAKRYSSVVHTKRISQVATVLPKESQQEMAIIHSQYPQPTHVQPQPKADDRQSEPARSEMQVSRVSLPSTAKPVQQQRISQYAPSLPKEGQQEIPDIRSQYSQPPYILQQANVEGQQISQAKRYSSVVHTKRISQVATVLPKESQQEMAIRHSHYPQPTYVQQLPRAEVQQPAVQAHAVQQPQTVMPSKSDIVLKSKDDVLQPKSTKIEMEEAKTKQDVSTLLEKQESYATQPKRIIEPTEEKKVKEDIVPVSAEKPLKVDIKQPEPIRYEKQASAQQLGEAFFEKEGSYVSQPKQISEHVLIPSKKEKKDLKEIGTKSQLSFAEKPTIVDIKQPEPIRYEKQASAQQLGEAFFEKEGSYVSQPKQISEHVLIPSKKEKKDLKEIGTKSQLSFAEKPTIVSIPQRESIRYEKPASAQQLGVVFLEKEGSYVSQPKQISEHVQIPSKKEKKDLKEIGTKSQLSFAEKPTIVNIPQRESIRYEKQASAQQLGVVFLEKEGSYVSQPKHISEHMLIPSMKEKKDLKETSIKSQLSFAEKPTIVDIPQSEPKKKEPDAQQPGPPLLERHESKATLSKPTSDHIPSSSKEVKKEKTDFDTTSVEKTTKVDIKPPAAMEIVLPEPKEKQTLPALLEKQETQATHTKQIIEPSPLPLKEVKKDKEDLGATSAKKLQIVDVSQPEPKKIDIEAKTKQAVPTSPEKSITAQPTKISEPLPISIQEGTKDITDFGPLYQKPSVEKPPKDVKPLPAQKIDYHEPTLLEKQESKATLPERISEQARGSSKEGKEDFGPPSTERLPKIDVTPTVPMEIDIHKPSVKQAVPPPTEKQESKITQPKRISEHVPLPSKEVKKDFGPPSSEKPPKVDDTQPMAMKSDIPKPSERQMVPPLSEKQESKITQPKRISEHVPLPSKEVKKDFGPPSSEKPPKVDDTQPLAMKTDMPKLSEKQIVPTLSEKEESKVTLPKRTSEHVPLPSKERKEDLGQPSTKKPPKVDVTQPVAIKTDIPEPSEKQKVPTLPEKQDSKTTLPKRISELVPISLGEPSTKEPPKVDDTLPVAMKSDITKLSEKQTVLPLPEKQESEAKLPKIISEHGLLPSKERKEDLGEPFTEKPPKVEVTQTVAMKTDIPEPSEKQKVAHLPEKQDSKTKHKTISEHVPISLGEPSTEEPPKVDDTLPAPMKSDMLKPREEQMLPPSPEKQESKATLPKRISEHVPISSKERKEDLGEPSTEKPPIQDVIQPVAMKSDIPKPSEKQMVLPLSKIQDSKVTLPKKMSEYVPGPPQEEKEDFGSSEKQKAEKPPKVDVIQPVPMKSDMPKPSEKQMTPPLTEKQDSKVTLPKGISEHAVIPSKEEKEDFSPLSTETKQKLDVTQPVAMKTDVLKPSEKHMVPPLLEKQEIFEGPLKRIADGAPILLKEEKKKISDFGPPSAEKPPKVDVKPSEPVKIEKQEPGVQQPELTLLEKQESDMSQPKKIPEYVPILTKEEKMDHKEISPKSQVVLTEKLLKVDTDQSEPEKKEPDTQHPSIVVDIHEPSTKSIEPTLLEKEIFVGPSKRSSEGAPILPKEEKKEIIDFGPSSAEKPTEVDVKPPVAKEVDMKKSEHAVPTLLETQESYATQSKITSEPELISSKEEKQDIKDLGLQSVPQPQQPEYIDVHEHHPKLTVPTLPEKEESYVAPTKSIPESISITLDLDQPYSEPIFMQILPDDRHPDLTRVDKEDLSTTHPVPIHIDEQGAPPYQQQLPPTSETVKYEKEVSEFTYPSSSVTGVETMQGMPEYGPQYPQVHDRQLSEPDVQYEPARYEKDSYPGPSKFESGESYAVPTHPREVMQDMPDYDQQYDQPSYIQQMQTVDVRKSVPVIYEVVEPDEPYPGYAVPTKRFSEYMPIHSREGMQDMPDYDHQYEKPTYAQQVPTVDGRQSIPIIYEDVVLEETYQGQPLVAQQEVLQEVPDFDSKYSQPYYVQEQPIVYDEQPEIIRYEINEQGGTYPSLYDDGYVVSSQRHSEYMPIQSTESIEVMPGYGSENLQPLPKIVRLSVPVIYEIVEPKEMYQDGQTLVGEQDNYVIQPQRLSEYVPISSKEGDMPEYEQYSQSHYTQQLPEPRYEVMEPESIEYEMVEHEETHPGLYTEEQDGYPAYVKRYSEYVPPMLERTEKTDAQEYRAPEYWSEDGQPIILSGQPTIFEQQEVQEMHPYYDENAPPRYYLEEEQQEQPYQEKYYPDIGMIEMVTPFNEDIRSISQVIYRSEGEPLDYYAEKEHEYSIIESKTDQEDIFEGSTTEPQQGEGTEIPPKEQETEAPDHKSLPGMELPKESDFLSPAFDFDSKVETLKKDQSRQSQKDFLISESEKVSEPSKISAPDLETQECPTLAAHSETKSNMSDIKLKSKSLTDISLKETSDYLTESTEMPTDKVRKVLSQPDARVSVKSGSQHDELPVKDAQKDTSTVKEKESIIGDAEIEELVDRIKQKVSSTRLSPKTSSEKYRTSIITEKVGMKEEAGEDVKSIEMEKSTKISSTCEDVPVESTSVSSHEKMEQDTMVRTISSEGHKVEEGYQSETGTDFDERKLLKKVMDWFENVKIEAEETEIQNVLREVVEKKICSTLSVEEFGESSVKAVAKKISRWIENEVDEIINDIEKGMITLPPCRTQQRKGPTFHVKKDGFAYDITPICDELVKNKVDANKAHFYPDLNNPSKEGPLLKSEFKTWARWATDVVTVAELWANWIDDTCAQAQQKVKDRKEAKYRNITDQNEKEFRQWQKNVQDDALEWQRNKQLLKKVAAFWHQKAQQVLD